MIFQDRVKYIRGELTQKDFAKKIGVSLGSVQHWEIDGQFPRGDVLKKIKEILNVDINWLLTGEGEPYIKEGNCSPSIIPAETSNVIELKHMDLVRGFQDKQRALEINRRLIELEMLDPESFRRVESYIKGTVDTIREVAERSPHYGVQGRKDTKSSDDEDDEGGPPDGFDRRLGPDRCKARPPG